MCVCFENLGVFIFYHFDVLKVVYVCNLELSMKCDFNLNGSAYSGDTVLFVPNLCTCTSNDSTYIGFYP